MRSTIAWMVGLGAVTFAAVAWAQSSPPPANPFVGAMPGPDTITSPSGNAPPHVATPPAGAPATAPVIAGPRCTIATITEDVGTNDTFLSRMTFPAPEAPASPQQSPVCPAGAAHVAAQRALDACRQRAFNPYNCAFADTDHAFDITSDVVDSSALDTQCASYAAKFIGLACEPGQTQDNCSVACGDTAAAARDAAQTRCNTTHGDACPLVNAAPVQAP